MKQTSAKETERDVPLARDNKHDAVPSASKRTLLKAAAWVPPAIVALTLPRSSYAANVSGTNRSGTSGDKGNNGNHFGQLKNE